MKILVTGANGFVGRHLCDLLDKRGDQVIAGRGPPLNGLDRPEGLFIDVTDKSVCRLAIEQSQPEAIIHLAGFSSVAQSHEDPFKALWINTVGTVNLLTAARDRCPKAKVLVIGSGDMYGSVPPGNRATEQTPLNPLSPYASSKVGAEIAAIQFQKSYGLQILCARPFNHLGKGQAPSFVVPSFARQLIAIKKREAEAVLKTGDLSPVRDFSHVDDVAEAYRLLLDVGRPGETYNVCSGEGRSIQSLLTEMAEIAGVKPRIEVDIARLRPVEIPSLVGDPKKLKSLGWAPKRTVRQALEEVLLS